MGIDDDNISPPAEKSPDLGRITLSTRVEINRFTVVCS